MSEPIIYNEVFSHEDFCTILNKVSGPVWEFGHTSYPKGDARFRLCTPFWKIDFSNDEFFTVHLLNKIQEKTNESFSLTHVYANGHTYGIDGTFHQDGYTDDDRTFVLYAMSKWDKEWGGYTSYRLSDDHVYSVYPAPNRAVYHHGKVYHTSGPISRQYPGLRVTVAWKLTLNK